LVEEDQRAILWLKKSEFGMVIPPWMIFRQASYQPRLISTPT
jgi:hypothetical protein